jgi:hypothetical protein
MALLGYHIVLKVQQHSSGVADAIIAESTSVSIDFSAEALETTSQTSALNATFIGGKVSGTASGDYLLASAGTQFSLLFAKMNAGEVLEMSVERSGTPFLDGECVITSLGLGGGLSDSLATGSYSLQFSGNMAV